MSLRKTSCLSCVAAKRGCDRALPACRRCSRQSLECQYPYPPAVARNPLPVAGRAPQAVSEAPPATADQALEAILGEITGENAPRNGQDAQVEGHDAHWLLGSGLDNTSAGWIEEFPDLSKTAFTEWTDNSGALQMISPLPSPRQRRVRKHQVRRLQHAFRGPVLHTSKPYSPGPVNALSLCYLGPWNRAEEVETWEFCASEMLSFISLYAETGSSPMMVRAAPESADLHPVLGKALGVCAAHETLAKTHRNVFDQLLDRELHDLVTSSTASAFHDAVGQRHNLETIVRESVARLQALVLYQIIRLFSNKARDLRKSAQEEALFASWTRELQFQVELLQQSPPTQNASSPLMGPALLTVDPETLESAYRTIMISYEVRAVHSVLTYKHCSVWDDLFAIIVPASLSGPKPLLYPDYVVEWDKGLVPRVSGEDRRFQNLILAACKGVGVVDQEAA